MNGYMIDQIVAVVGEHHKEALSVAFSDVDVVAWSVEDLKTLLGEDGTYRGETFSDAELRYILHNVVEDHDADLGISWETLSCALDEAVNERKESK